METDKKTYSPAPTYAIRAFKRGVAVGWVGGIGYDLISRKETLHLRRYRKDALLFSTRKEAQAWIDASPQLGSELKISFKVAGKGVRRR